MRRRNRESSANRSQPANMASLDASRLGFRVWFDSTSIRSARYLAERQILDLEFQGGTLYRYHDVPDMVFRELLTAESKGAFVNQVIKPHFSFTQLTSGA